MNPDRIKIFTGSANPAAVKDGLDAQTMQGLINTAYKLPNFRIASILKNTHIEQLPGAEARCSFELPILGKRTTTAPTALQAIRAALLELTDVLTRTPPGKWPEGWRRRRVALFEHSHDMLRQRIALIGKTPGENDRGIEYESAHRRPSLIKSLIFSPCKDKP